MFFLPNVVSMIWETKISLVSHVLHVFVGANKDCFLLHSIVRRPSSIIKDLQTPYMHLEETRRGVFWSLERGNTCLSYVAYVKGFFKVFLLIDQLICLKAIQSGCHSRLKKKKLWNCDDGTDVSYSFIDLI